MSIIKYARKADIKRGLNERFKEIYPHIELPLTRLIKSANHPTHLPKLTHSLFNVSFSVESRKGCVKLLLR